MPQNYSGNPANVTSLGRFITNCGAGAGGKIRVTTSVSHLFSTNDYVTITGVVGTTEANGWWKITVIDSTKFDLLGPTFTNAYVSGGQAIDDSLTPAFQIPDDGEAATVQSITASIQALADRTQYLKVFEGSLISNVNITTSVTVRSPLGANFALLVGYGGGGGGGGGGGPADPSPASLYSTGGGGGGGAVQSTVMLPIAENTNYPVVIGAGGDGGTFGDPGDGVAGTDGGDTTFDTTGATFKGAGGGFGGVSETSAAGGLRPGGSAVSPSVNSLVSLSAFGDITISGLQAIRRTPSEGGYGMTAALGSVRAGAGIGMSGTVIYNNTAGAGGARGTPLGTSDGTSFGGGVGGGGGGGPQGNGGHGGYGGNGHAAGNGDPAGPATAADPGSGAGGGGGGGGGCGTPASASSGAGSKGQAGGSGGLSIYWLR